MTSIQSIYVNLPIRDVNKTRDFWTKLGFTFNEQFSDENALCMVMKKDSIYAMLITHKMYATFTNRPIADGSTTQVLVAIEVASKNKVNELIEIALTNGGSRYRDAADHGWMYYDSFADIDGHQWEVMALDPLKMPGPGA